ncbi:hypothetical protein NLU13_0715 [Sarocladium strictum]|uniref:Uncharacterized protein n=1 Tax=Sarocladium strictum TaxID=5046 RepID=A0AA39GQB7_SARSR|nr:hypothetical protein NLU13_0715 [Sarocladium strictum]
MKFSTILSGLFAATAIAAPVSSSTATTTEARDVVDTSPNPLSARTVFNAGSFNNLRFNQIDLRYLQGLNAFDLQLFQTLSVRNNLDVVFFQNVFNAQVFDINALLQLQSLHTLLLIGRTGVFNSFDLRGLQFSNLNFGLINSLAGVDLVQFIDTSFSSQIQTVADAVSVQII